LSRIPITTFKINEEGDVRNVDVEGGTRFAHERDVLRLIVDHDVRVTELLEANNREVARRRKLAVAVRQAALQFAFYGEAHAQKSTKDGDTKAEVNRTLAKTMLEALKDD
jgi:hypothetical protein